MGRSDALDFQPQQPPRRDRTGQLSPALQWLPSPVSQQQLQQVRDVVRSAGAAS